MKVPYFRRLSVITEELNGPIGQVICSRHILRNALEIARDSLYLLFQRQNGVHVLPRELVSRVFGLHRGAPRRVARAKGWHHWLLPSALSPSCFHRPLDNDLWLCGTDLIILLSDRQGRRVLTPEGGRPAGAKGRSAERSALNPQ